MRTILALSLLALSSLSACTKSTSIAQFNMIPGAEAAVACHAETSTVEIRNVGTEPAEITIQGDQPIVGAPQTLAPNAAWKQTFPGDVEILLHNRGTSIARLQVFSPNWNDYRIALFPEGRKDRVDAIMIVEPTDPGWYKNTGRPQ